MQKIGLFVDVQNIYYTTRQTYGRQFNYRAMWKMLEAHGHINTANAYATDRGDDSQKKFQTALRHIGFDVKLKPYIQRADGSAKGDWDVGIAIDILLNAPEMDRIFLLSGDGDFDLLVETVQDKYRVPVEVYGVPALTADSLKRAASSFHPITETLLL
ncbi:MAG: uncharacterized LabA/DUF88 family protein [Candidatus Azotimanducaceae bacterium]|jgi:uncharacterized LabA/DUF88 family protein